MYAQDPAPQKAPEAVAEKVATPQAETKKLTKEEMITSLKNIFQYNPDVISTIKGLSAKADKEGAYYEYNGKRLEELDKEALQAILRAANSFMSLKRMRETERQFRTLKQIENINKTQRMLKATGAAYNPPKVPNTYKAPVTYKTPR